LSKEEKLKEVVDRLQRLAEKQKSIDERMKRVEKYLQDKPEE
jgi:hypothetical protein